MNQSISDYISEYNQVQERGQSVKDDINNARNRILQAISSEQDFKNQALAAVGDAANTLGGVILERSFEPYVNLGLNQVGSSVKGLFNDAGSFLKSKFLDEAGDRPSVQSLMPKLPQQEPEPEADDVLPVNEGDIPLDTFSSNAPKDVSAEPEDAAEPEPMDQLAPMRQELMRTDEMDNELLPEGAGEHVNLVEQAQDAAEQVEAPAQQEVSEITSNVARETGDSGVTAGEIEAGDVTAEAGEAAGEAGAEAAGEAGAEAAGEAIAASTGAETGGIGFLVGGLVEGVSELVGSINKRRQRREEEAKEASENLDIAQAQQEISKVNQETQENLQRLSKPTIDQGIN